MGQPAAAAAAGVHCGQQCGTDMHGRSRRFGGPPQPSPPPPPSMRCRWRRETATRPAASRASSTRAAAAAALHVHHPSPPLALSLPPFPLLASLGPHPWGCPLPAPTCVPPPRRYNESWWAWSEVKDVRDIEEARLQVRCRHHRCRRRAAAAARRAVPRPRARTSRAALAAVHAVAGQTCRCTLPPVGAEHPGALPAQAAGEVMAYFLGANKDGACCLLHACCGCCSLCACAPACLPACLRSCQPSATQRPLRAAQAAPARRRHRRHCAMRQLAVHATAARRQCHHIQQINARGQRLRHRPRCAIGLRHGAAPWGSGPQPQPPGIDLSDVMALAVAGGGGVDSQPWPCKAVLQGQSPGCGPNSRAPRATPPQASPSCLAPLWPHNVSLPEREAAGSSNWGLGRVRGTAGRRAGQRQRCRLGLLRCAETPAASHRAPVPA